MADYRMSVRIQTDRVLTEDQEERIAQALQDIVADELNELDELGRLIGNLDGSGVYFGAVVRT